MTEHDDSLTNGLVVRRNLSLRQRLASALPLIYFLVACTFLAGMAGGVVVVAGAGSAFFSTWFAVILAIGCGAVLSLTAVAGLSVINNVRVRKRRKLMSFQQQLVEKTSDDFCSDLQKLVQGYLELKEFQIADYYSSMLLKESALPPDQRAAKLTQPIYTIGCWTSTPAYHRTPMYWAIWLFESRGNLVLSPSHLEFSGDRISFKIDLADIRSYTLEHHSRWLKPIPFKFISLKFLDNGIEQNVYITPSFAQTDSIYQANNCTEQWLELLKVAHEKRVAARAIEKMRAQIPGVEPSSQPKV